MTDQDKLLFSMGEKLDSLIEAKQEAKSSMLDLVSQLKEVIHRISILERFDVKRIDRLETYFDMLKDRLLIIESKGPPAMDQVVEQQDQFKTDFIDLKVKMENIGKTLEQKNVHWQNIILTFIQIMGTILSAIILFKMGMR